MHKIKYRLKYTLIKEVKWSGLVLFSLLFLVGTASFPSTAMSAPNCPAALIADYLFDGNGNDSTGYSNAMNLTNVSYVDNHLSLNGLYDIDCPNTGYRATATIPCFSFNAFTVSLDFYPTLWDYFVCGYSSNILTGGVSNRWFRIRSDFSTGNLNLTLNNDPGVSSYFEHVFSNTSMSLNQWHNVVVSIDVTNKKIITFLDGTKLEDLTLDPSFVLTHSSDNNITFTDYSDAQTFYGLADNLKIFNYALSAEQIGLIGTTFNVIASVPGEIGGTVDPSSQPVVYGGTATINIYPATGYHIAKITDNGTSVGVANPYVISNVTAAHDVVVTFAADAPPSMTKEVVGNYVICTETGASGCPQTMYVCPGELDCNTCATEANRCGNMALSAVRFNAGDLLYLGGSSFGGGSVPVCKTTDFVTRDIAYRCIEGIDYCFTCGNPTATGGSNSIVALPQATKIQERFEFQGSSVWMCGSQADSICLNDVYSCPSATEQNPCSCDSQVPWPTTSLSDVTFGLGELKYVGGGSDGPDCDVVYFVTTQCIFRCYPASNNCFSYCPE